MTRPLTADDLDRIEQTAREKYMNTAYTTVMMLLRECRRLNHERTFAAQPYELEDGYESEHV